MSRRRGRSRTRRRRGGRWRRLRRYRRRDQQGIGREQRGERPRDAHHASARRNCGRRSYVSTIVTNVARRSAAPCVLSRASSSCARPFPQQRGQPVVHALLRRPPVEAVRFLLCATKGEQPRGEPNVAVERDGEREVEHADRGLDLETRRRARHGDSATCGGERARHVVERDPIAGEIRVERQLVLRQQHVLPAAQTVLDVRDRATRLATRVLGFAEERDRVHLAIRIADGSAALHPPHVRLHGRREVAGHQREMAAIAGERPG